MGAGRRPPAGERGEIRRERRDDLLRFFDHFLKGADNGWDQASRVRYSLLDLEGGNRVTIPAGEFPPEDVTTTKYYLDGRSRALSTTPPADGASAAYLVGSNPVSFTVPNTGGAIQDVTERGASILRYKGSDGRLRVSLRHLDETLSTDAVPVHTFDRVEKLSDGEIVAIDVDLLPIGLVFHPGEQLRLIVSGRNLLGGMMPALREYIPSNTGQHIVHTGGEHASYLQLPVQG